MPSTRVALLVPAVLLLLAACQETALPPVDTEPRLSVNPTSNSGSCSAWLGDLEITPGNGAGDGFNSGNLSLGRCTDVPRQTYNVEVVFKINAEDFTERFVNQNWRLYATRFQSRAEFVSPESGDLLTCDKHFSSRVLSRELIASGGPMVSNGTMDGWLTMEPVSISTPLTPLPQWGSFVPNCGYWWDREIFVELELDLSTGPGIDPMGAIDRIIYRVP